MRLAPLDTLCALSDEALAALRSSFVAAGYTPSVVADCERIAPGLVDGLRLPLVQAELRAAPTPGRTLARLLLYLDVVDETEVTALLGVTTTRDLLEAGALAHADGGLRAAVIVAPCFELYVLSDPLDAHADAVMGPGPTTLHLAEALPRAAVASVLDVGCGAGTLALLAASRGAQTAVGVDISPRAVAISTLNARLNGVRARFVVSDLCAAVAGERFDLVVSQPAFIAQPPDVDASVFAHGGPRGDELALRLLAELPGLLREGGSAVVLVQSATPAEAPLHQRARAALGASAAGLMVLTAPSMGPDAYSIGYATMVDASLGARWREAALRYRAHLRAMSVESFQYGLVCVRADGLGYTLTLPVLGLRGLGADALQGLADGLALAARADDALLDAGVRCADGVAWIEERDRPDSATRPRWIARFRALPFADRELSEASWALLELLDVSARVRDAVTAYARLCDADPREVAPQVLGFVRDSLARGLLAPS
ncbi:MAG: methyltransferase [Polyangiales bacterium]